MTGSVPGHHMPRCQVTSACLPSTKGCPGIGKVTRAITEGKGRPAPCSNAPTIYPHRVEATKYVSLMQRNLQRVYSQR